MKTYPTYFWALGALALLCLSCQQTPLLTTTLDISGTWQIQTNTWRKVGLTERDGQELLPGTVEFAPLTDTTSTGSWSYFLDGDSVQESFRYALIGDSLVIAPKGSANGRDALYTALGVSELSIFIQGSRRLPDPVNGDSLVLSEEILLQK